VSHRNNWYEAPAGIFTQINPGDRTRDAGVDPAIVIHGDTVIDIVGLVCGLLERLPSHAVSDGNFVLPNRWELC
jgi:hypothetical protein